MIYLDSEGYPVNVTKDGMDSSVREGILQITQPEIWKKVKDPDNYERNGFLMRHPLQDTASNERNNTRDNMLPMIAALFARDEVAALRRVFWRVVKRGCFSQSFERDVRGSGKKLYPHKFYKDSWSTITLKHDTITVPLWKHLSPHSKIVKRWIDWADPFMPGHMAMLIRATQYKWLYPLMLPGLLWLWVSFLFMKQNSQKDTELNQLFCQCYVLGPYWLRKIKTLPDWELSFRNYWGKRKESEYADYIIEYLKKL